MPRTNKKLLMFANEQSLALHSTLAMLSLTDKELLFEKFADFTQELTNQITKELKQ